MRESLAKSRQPAPTGARRRHPDPSTDDPVSVLIASIADVHVIRERHNIGHVPALYAVTGLCTQQCAALYGARLTEVATIVCGDRYKAVLVTHKEYERFGDELLTVTASRRGFVRGIYRAALRAGADLIAATSRAAKQSDHTPQHQTGAEYKKYVQLYSLFNLYVFPLWFILGEKLTDVLLSWCQKHGLTRDDFNVLQTPHKPSSAQRQELDLLELAGRIAAKHHRPFASSDHLLQFVSSDGDLKRRLRKVVSEHGWTLFDYVGPRVLDEADFCKALFDILALVVPPEKRRRNLLASLNATRRKQEQLSASAQVPPDVKRLFSDLRISVFLSDYRKVVTTRAHVYLQTRLFPRLATALRLDPKLLRYMSITEVTRLLDQRAERPRDLAERPRASVMVFDGYTYAVETGQRARAAWKLLEPSTVDSLNRIEGRPASPGVKQGPARIVLSPTETDRVQKGDVLVATATTPDFLPAMRRATAIVTDEGGSTSHAAILSRELGVPCVVATRVATRVFNDDDLLEVDGNAGTVTRLTYPRHVRTR
jgi:phosphohistidine swiveling domain-containing protein